MRVVFLGPPGAGKGTQAERLAAHLDIPHVATGDILRDAVESGSEFGRKVAEYMDRGDLVPDSIMNEVARERLSLTDALQGFVLDGFPRNEDQAAVLDDALEEQGVKLDRVLKFMVFKEEIVRRLSGRRICTVCNSTYHVDDRPSKKERLCDNDQTPLIQREDDEPETVRNRLEIYGRQTKPLYEMYENRGLLVNIDAIGSSDDVFARVREAVGV